MLLQGRGFLEDTPGAITHHSPQLAMGGIQGCLPSHESGCSLVNICNDELDSMARNHFARRCTVKTKTMISTAVILQYYFKRRAEAEEEGCYHGHCGRPWHGRMPGTGYVQDAHISSKALPSTAML